MLHYLARSKLNKTPSVKFKFQATPPGGTAFEIWADLWITDSTVDRTEKTLFEVFNWDGKLESCSSGDWVGTKCILVLEDEPDQNGNPRKKVRFINPVRVAQDPEAAAEAIAAAQAVLTKRRQRPIVGDLPIPQTTSVTRHPNPIMKDEIPPPFLNPDPYGEGVPF
jgi:hypothetical protein